jgi:lipopolysaccharide transport system ATP-binding protein
LRDVSFTVQQGEVLGIIGRNGAGKSTLLKILSRVTAPTSGRIRVKGRIASLLEVGTGFHPELTGRENIYLNGAILGMKRDEITRKFDEIVDFAEVEKFIDTPVKRYSSGMYVRLAFAVAAHLEPEILVVDEVLAVGDAEFQKKCLGKMGEVAKGGRTILFVSHNLGAINSLCNKSLLVNNGRLLNYGDTRIIVSEYLSQFSILNSQVVVKNHRSSESLSITTIQVVRISQDKMMNTNVLINIKIHLGVTKKFNVEWHLVSSTGQHIAFGSPQHFKHELLEAMPGEYNVYLEILDIPLGAGRYFLDIGITKANVEYFARINQAIIIDVPNFDPYNVGWSYIPEGEYGSFTFQDRTWLEEVS